MIRDRENFFPWTFRGVCVTSLVYKNHSVIARACLFFHITHNTHKNTHTKKHSEQIHVSAAARWVVARKEALLFALIVLPLVFDLLFSLIVVLE
jgi:hypothetical protein